MRGTTLGSCDLILGVGVGLMRDTNESRLAGANEKYKPHPLTMVTMVTKALPSQSLT